MYGIAAITAKNGWAMAIAGALIVMSGLTVLALVISQLKKLAEFIEKRRAVPAPPGEMPAAAKETVPSIDMNEVAARYQLMAQQLGDSFELRRLYHLASDSGYPHIHLSIRSLREMGLLIPLGGGLFTWQQ